MIGASLIKELKLLGRDLHGLAVLFVMPIMFMLIMSVALSRDDDPHINSKTALVGNSNNSVNQALALALQQEGMLIERLPSNQLAQAQSGLHDGRYHIVIYNRNTGNDALTEETPLQLFVPPNTEPSWLAAIKGVLQQHYTDVRLNAYFAHAKDIQVEGKGLPKNLRTKMQQTLDDASSERFDAITAYLQHTLLEEHYIGQHQQALNKPNAVQHSVPAWLIFGMFFIMIPLSNVMALERQTNTLTRLRLAHAPAWILLAAKLLPYFLINQLQFIGMLLLGRYILPLLGVPALILTGTLWHYAILSIAVSLAALGYALLISVLAKSTEHAVVLGGGGIILMAALGGIMVPDYVMPEVMQQLTWLSPMAWGLKAFQQLLLNQTGLNGIVLYLQLLSAWAVFSLSAAVYCYHQQLRTQARF